ncbi:MAG: hypothetical protein LBH94_03770 [Deltaproteobacteria bacterium]|jgi:hypothetical protein|nr:hypothetical protein [Deltaproteobacteria bacterium]
MHKKHIEMLEQYLGDRRAVVPQFAVRRERRIFLRRECTLTVHALLSLSVSGLRPPTATATKAKNEPAAAVGESTSLTDGDGIATKYHGKLGHYQARIKLDKSVKQSYAAAFKA